MTINSEQKDPKIYHVLAQDLNNQGYFTILKKEWIELKDFMLSDEQKEKIKSFGKIKGSLYFSWRLFKALILKLTPIRRLLLLFGIILSLNFIFGSDGVGISPNTFLGIIIILFVLMLELKDKLLAQEELNAGHIVQKTLEPEKSPEINGWKLWLFTRYANEVGGDLIDFTNVKDEEYALVVGDVCGKGLRAALHAAKLQATIRALLSDYSSLKILFEKMNRLFKKYSMSNFFATLLLVRLNSINSKVEIVNAGHIPPIIFENNLLRTFPKGNAAIGILPNPDFTEIFMELNKGDWFIIYSDGLNEAKNISGDFFGDERLKNLLSRYSKESIDVIGDKLIVELDKFVGNARLHDDITIALVKKL